ncbi:hypothetical protein J4450_03365 [Candidatus Micrarchaeota archaeon]|nr:hypothetical protein [Candidatus Micrarchaeota archaeon]
MAETKSVDDLLAEMRNNGITGAVVRNDGILISSTISLSESGASTFASLSNVCDALLKTLKDTQREIEISAGGLFLVLLPVGSYLLCGVVKSRDQKKMLKEYADKLKQIV